MNIEEAHFQALLEDCVRDLIWGVVGEVFTRYEKNGYEVRKL
jgi:hypothetical protein